MCAAYSQNNNHRDALYHANLAALICEDNIVKTYHLLRQTKKEIENEKNFSNKKYSKIFIEKLEENEPAIISLNEKIMECARNYKTGKNINKKAFVKEDILSFINDKKNKISTRNILGVIKNDDWLNLFNIGNIMFLYAMSYDDLDLDSDPKYELLRDAIIEKILMLTVSFFSIANELVDSLVFNDLYGYLFTKCLVKFNEEDEKKVKMKLKDFNSKYEWEGLGVKEIYHQCKFLSAIQFLDNISNYHTIFEKMDVLTNVNTLITEEAKNIYESNTKGNFIPQGDLLLTFWTYVVAHCNTKNIIAESQFINFFGLNGYNASNYVATTFITAVDTIKLESLQNEKIILSQYVEPNKIELPSK